VRGGGSVETRWRLSRDSLGGGGRLARSAGRLEPQIENFLKKRKERV
jgi:hypothetical protein